MTGNITIWLAFAAGLLSFLSPCVLPLLPSYLCVIGGIQMGDLSDKKGKFKPWLVIKTLFFVLGFSAVFITLSIVLSASISLMGSALVWISRISGIIVILLGLNIIFDFLKFLNYEKRFHLSNTPRGAIGAIVTGAAFGAGWTPCVGPVLAGILLLAAQSGGIPKAVTYLIFFSAGLGLPFIAASVFFDVFLKAKNSLNKHLPLIRRISGILLVILGILMITGQFRTLGSLAAQWQQNTAKTGVSAGEPAVPVTPAASPYDTPQPVIDAFRNAQLPVAAKGNKPIDFTVPLANGGTVKLSDLQGKVVFLNFWATWCGPCRAEMPSMEAVYQRLRNRDFVILAVNIMEKPDIVTAFIRDNGLAFTAALDTSGSIANAYGIQAIPTSFIIDKRGLILSKITGSIDWNKASIIAALETLL